MRARRASKIYILFFEKQFVIYARSLFLNLNKANCKLSLKCSIFFHSRQYIGRLDSKTVKDKFAILHFLFRRLKTKDERERKVSQQKFACCKRVWVVLIFLVIFKKCGYSIVKKKYIYQNSFPDSYRKVDIIITFLHWPMTMKYSAEQRFVYVFKTKKS